MGSLRSLIAKISIIYSSQLSKVWYSEKLTQAHLIQWDSMSDASPLTEAKARSKWPTQTFPPMPLHPMKNNERHSQVKDTIRKQSAKQAEETRALNLRCFHQKHHVPLSASPSSFWRKWNPSLGFQERFMTEKNRFTWQWVHARFVLFHGRPNCSLFCRC